MGPLMNPDFSYETLVYKEAAGRRLRLFVCRPDEWCAADVRPAVVWIHGGGWRGGQPDMLLRHCRLFTARGAVTVSVEYRLMPPENKEAEPGQAPGIEACIEDCRSAIRYLRSHAAELGIDPLRIAVVGDSAGGHLAVSLAAMEGYDALGEDVSISARANAVVNCNGIVDFTGRWKKMVPEVDAEAAGGDPVRAWLLRHERAKALSPLYHVHADQPPMLILHGLRDATVAPEDAVRFYEAYMEAGNEAELVLYSHLAHAFVLFDYKTEEREVLKVLERIDQFLTSYGYLPEQDH